MINLPFIEFVLMVQMIRNFHKEDLALKNKTNIQCQNYLKMKMYFIPKSASC